ncbi:sterile alpha motif domain-containing protein 15-like [Tubulanus polymorphus]|uniref:sterile alpha motif domain-containing protein 15-like n=1 Tax=Tubulanus polymorphus TaxID=672921 RepID=UPI003DA4513E
MAQLASTRKNLERKVQALVPHCVTWPEQQVACWISDLGFPQYKVASYFHITDKRKLCFIDNFINGKKLIFLDMCSLPKIGITDYEHMKVITKAIRKLLGIPTPDMYRSIGLPRREALELYLEAKSRTGVKIDKLSFSRFLQDNATKLRTHKE